MDIKEFASLGGKKGGKSRSNKKLRACRRNGFKPGNKFGARKRAQNAPAGASIETSPAGAPILTAGAQ
jgi:hypothetical protein